MKKSGFLFVLFIALITLTFSACPDPDSVADTTFTLQEEEGTSSSEEVFEATDEQYAELKPYLDLLFDSAGCFWYCNNTGSSSSTETINTTLLEDGTISVTNWCSDGSIASWSIATDGTITRSDEENSSYPTSTLTKNDDGTYKVKTTYSDSSTTEGTITITVNDDESYTVETTYSNGSTTKETIYPDYYGSNDNSFSEKIDSHECCYVGSFSSTSEEINIEFNDHEFTYETAEGISYVASSINGKVYETDELKSDTDTYGAASFSVEMICDGKEISVTLYTEIICSYDSNTDTDSISSFSGSATIKVDGVAYSLTEEQLKDFWGSF